MLRVGLKAVVVNCRSGPDAEAVTQVTAVPLSRAAPSVPADKLLGVVRVKR